ncbi:MAG: sodium:solute symporter family transporter [Bacteroidota bacterium]
MNNIGESFGTIDFAAIAVVILLFLLISFFAGKKEGSNIFSQSQKLSWWMASASVLMIFWNPSFDMMNTALVLESGYAGLWLTKDILLTMGIGTILFAPMWGRLNITTDNQLISLRYSGIGAKILQNFRAIYVGFFVVAFLGSIYILAIKKILEAIFPISETLFFFFAFIALLILISRNTFHKKVRTDAFVAILFLLLLIPAIYFLITGMGGWESMQLSLISSQEEKLSLLSIKNKESFNFDILIFLFVQWWSVRILDYSNASVQRYLAVKDAWAAFKSIFIPVIVLSALFAAFSFVWDAALLKADSNTDGEQLFVQLWLAYAPAGLKGLLLICLIFGVMTTFESSINWGASLVTIDVLKGHLFPKMNDRTIKITSYAVMGLIGLLSFTIAAYSEYLIKLQKLLFSMSAGVGLVFILRWFWWRVNAWSQLSAMLASLVYTLCFEFAYIEFTFFQNWVNQTADLLQLSYYPFKIIVLTITVTITWLAVTFLTPPDNEKKLKKFVEQTKTSGFWNFKINHTYFWKEKLGLIIIISLVAVLPMFIITQLKFGDSVFGFSLLALWLFLSILVFRKMKKFLKRI